MKARTIRESVAQIADSLDRLVTLAEDLSDAVELPKQNRTWAERTDDVE